MMNLPVFFTSVAARAARLFKTLEQAADFSSCSPAIAAAIRNRHQVAVGGDKDIKVDELTGHYPFDKED